MLVSALFLLISLFVLFFVVVDVAVVDGDDDK